MGIVSAIPEMCKRCYACVRECPAKAIKVEKGQALVIEERCIVCGNCVKVCAQNAKRIESSIEGVIHMLGRPQPVFACLAPSFPAAFNNVEAGKVIAAIRKLGFAEVWNVSFGAELVAREYAKLFEDSKRSGKTIIATPCPAVVAYVEKYMPKLRDALAPIVSPMIATARAIRFRKGNDVRVVFIGPCIAKKNEILDPYVIGVVDSVLTYKELTVMFEEAGIRVEDQEESPFDGPSAHVGKSFALSGGLLRTAGIGTDILDNDVITTEGKDRALQILREVEDDACHARFLDVLFCEGCISGPKMLNDLGMHARKEILAAFVKHENGGSSSALVDRALQSFSGLHLGRAFTPRDLLLPQPSEEQITRALQEMKKSALEDRLNCGACGYPTCRDKAVAVCQGLAEASMCLPYLVEELEATCTQLQESHQELAAAQQRLVQSERLASMGQLSAGVAHEINNPLGTVLIYSHMLLRQLRENDAVQSDLKMIVDEATRCKNIVRGLLDFARQSRVSKAPADLKALLNDIKMIMVPRAETAHVELETEVADDIPTMMIDIDQVKQMLVNLIRNAIEAAKPDEGKVALTARLRPEGDMVEIKISDNGCGIPQENLSRLFTPFFTTKEMGKGTGLGLAIAYGIVKMHSGDISVQSEEGQGTTFTICLPAARETQA